MGPTVESIEKLKLISKQDEKEGCSNTCLSIYTKTVSCCKSLEDEFWWIWKAVKNTQGKIKWLKIMYNKKNNGQSGFISYYLGMIKYQGTMTLVKL